MKAHVADTKAADAGQLEKRDKASKAAAKKKQSDKAKKQQKDKAKKASSK